MNEDDQLAQIRARLHTPRPELKARFGELYEQILAILQRHDPIGIGYLPDEYEPEVDTILLRLSEAHSLAALRRIIYEEFVWWFGSSEAASWEERLATSEAGLEENYEPIALEIWSVLQSYRGAE